METTTKWTDDTSAVAQWLNRTYETYNFWKAQGRQLFLQIAGESGTGDSNETRRRLAEEIRKHCESLTPVAQTVQQWDNGHTRVIDIDVSPPQSIRKAEWQIVADYVLLGACVEWDEWQTENDRRRAVNRKLENSHKKRLKSDQNATEPNYIPMLGLYTARQVANSD